jgi:hypothetical protein
VGVGPKGPTADNTDNTLSGLVLNGRLAPQAGLCWNGGACDGSEAAESNLDHVVIVGKQIK